MVNKLLKIDAIKLAVTILNHHPRQIADRMMASSSPLKTLSFDRFKMDSGDKNDRSNCLPRPSIHFEGFVFNDNPNRWFKNRRPRVSNLNFSAVTASDLTD